MLLKHLIQSTIYLIIFFMLRVKSKMYLKMGFIQMKIPHKCAVTISGIYRRISAQLMG